MSDDSDVDLLKRALRLDDTAAVNSSEESDVERDWVGGLAQRIIDPYYKERRAKGTFLYIQKANQPGRHMYLNEEVERIKWERDEAKIRAMLAAGQFKVSGVLDFSGGNDATRAHLSVQKLEPLDSYTHAGMAGEAVSEPPAKAAAAKESAGKSYDDSTHSRRRDEKRERKHHSSKGRRRGSSRSRSPDKDEKGSSRRKDRGFKAGKDDDRQPRHRRGSRRHDSSEESSPSPQPRRRERKSSRRRRNRSHDASEGDSSPAQAQPSRAHRSRRHETTDSDSPPSPPPRHRERKSSSRSQRTDDLRTSAGEQRRRHSNKPSRRREAVDGVRPEAVEGVRRRRAPSGDLQDTPHGERKHERLKRAEGSSRKLLRKDAEDASEPFKSRSTRNDQRDTRGKPDKKGWTELQEEKAAAPRAKHASPSAVVADDEVVKGNEAQNVYGIARNRKAAAWSSDDTDSEPEDAKQARKAQRETERAKARAEAEAANAKQANALEAAFEDEEAPQVWVPPEVRTEAMNDAQDEALLKEMSAVTPPTPQPAGEDEDGGTQKLKPLPVELGDDEDNEHGSKAAAGSNKSASPALQAGSQQPGSPKAESPKAGSSKARSHTTGSPKAESPKAGSPKARSHTTGSPPADASMA